MTTTVNVTVITMVNHQHKLEHFQAVTRTIMFQLRPVAYVIANDVIVFNHVI